jgi:hypothetical protein
MANSIISRTPARNPRNPAEREVSEYDGIWINFGIQTKDPDSGEEVFVRIGRGVPVSDLVVKPVYNNMDPAFAAEVGLQNDVIQQLQQRALQLEAGESIDVRMLSVSMLRRNEPVEATATEKPGTKFDIFA